MSQIAGIAHHYLSARDGDPTRRIAVLGGEGLLPPSFLAAHLALRFIAMGKRVMAMEGGVGSIDMSNYLGRPPLHLLSENLPVEQTGSPANGFQLVPYRMAAEHWGRVRPELWIRWMREEEAAAFLIVTLPDPTDLSPWYPTLRSLHDVVLQVHVGGQQAIPPAYRAIRLLYQHNPYLRVHLVFLPTARGGPATFATEALRLFGRLAESAQRLLRQEVLGPYLFHLEQPVIEAILDRKTEIPASSGLPSLLERLSREVTSVVPESVPYPGWFSVLERQTMEAGSGRKEAELFGRLDAYFPLEESVGPLQARLLLNWERRMAVGLMADRQIGEALQIGLETVDWVQDHLPLLGRLYGRRVDETLSPHLLLLASEFPPAFIRGASRMPVPVVLYRVWNGPYGSLPQRINPLPASAFTDDLTPEEVDTLKESLGRG